MIRKEKERKEIKEKLWVSMPELYEEQVEVLSYIALGMVYTNELKQSIKKDDLFQLDLF